MALKQSKKDKIIADAKAGRFKNVTDLCKKHKIARKTYYELEKSNNFKFRDNAGIVEASLILEQAKSNKSVTEIKAIEQAVKERISTTELDNEIMLNNRKLAKLFQAIILKNKDDITLKNVKSLTGSVKDLESMVNPQNSKTEFNVTQNNNNQSGVILTLDEAREKALSLGVPLEVLVK